MRALGNQIVWPITFAICIMLFAQPSALAAIGNFDTIVGRFQAGITRTLSYNFTLHRWVYRIDPADIQSFQIDIGFDPARAQFVQVDYVSPFVQTTSPDLSQLGSGLLNDVAGMTPSPVPGDVDIFQATFQDLHPELPIDNVTFTAFASSNDFVKIIDTDNGNAVVTIPPADIIGTSASIPEPVGAAAMVLFCAVFGVMHDRSRRSGAPERFGV